MNNNYYVASELLKKLANACDRIVVVALDGACVNAAFVKYALEAYRNAARPDHHWSSSSSQVAVTVGSVQRVCSEVEGMAELRIPRQPLNNNNNDGAPDVFQVPFASTRLYSQVTRSWIPAAADTKDRSKNGNNNEEDDEDEDDEDEVVVVNKQPQQQQWNQKKSKKNKKKNRKAARAQEEEEEEETTGGGGGGIEFSCRTFFQEPRLAQELGEDVYLIGSSRLKDWQESEDDGEVALTYAYDRDLLARNLDAFVRHRRAEALVFVCTFSTEIISRVADLQLTSIGANRVFHMCLSPGGNYKQLHRTVERMTEAQERFKNEFAPLTPAIAEDVALAAATHRWHRLVRRTVALDPDSTEKTGEFAHLVLLPSRQAAVFYYATGGSRVLLNNGLLDNHQHAAAASTRSDQLQLVRPFMDEVSANWGTDWQAINRVFYTGTASGRHRYMPKREQELVRQWLATMKFHDVDVRECTLLHPMNSMMVVIGEPLTPKKKTAAAAAAVVANNEEKPRALFVDRLNKNNNNSNRNGRPRRS